VFQKDRLLLVYVTMSLQSWLWFTLIGCWLAMSEMTLLKSITHKNPKSNLTIEMEGLHSHQGRLR
jgi:hypothetical protein